MRAPEILDELFDQAARALGSSNRARAWFGRPNENRGGRKSSKFRPLRAWSVILPGQATPFMRCATTAPYGVPGSSASQSKAFSQSVPGAGNAFLSRASTRRKLSHEPASETPPNARIRTPPWAAGSPRPWSGGSKRVRGIARAPSGASAGGCRACWTVGEGGLSRLPRSGMARRERHG